MLLREFSGNIAADINRWCWLYYVLRARDREGKVGWREAFKLHSVELGRLSLLFLYRYPKGRYKTHGHAGVEEEGRTKRTLLMSLEEPIKIAVKNPLYTLCSSLTCELVRDHRELGIFMGKVLSMSKMGYPRT